MHLLLLAFTLLLSGTSQAAPAAAGATAPAHAHETAPAKGRSPASDLAATAVCDNQSRIWVATQRQGQVFVMRSDDRGKTWSPPVPVNPLQEPLDSGGDARPKIALGPGGEILVTWTKELAKPYTGEVRFARSLDEGRSFRPPQTVHRHREEITHRFDALAVDPQGRIFVAWIDRRDAKLAAAARPPYRGAALYFAVSDDRGATFRGDFKAADHSCECCRIALAPQPAGGVVAFWRHIFEPNIRDHALVRLHPDGTASDFHRATSDDWRVDACPHQGPSLALALDETRHAVWFTAGPGGGEVWYGVLGDSARPVSRRRIGGRLAAHADLAVQSGRIAIAWKEFADDRTHLRALTSDNGGRDWREHSLAATARASDHPRVLAAPDGFLVFWNTLDTPLSVTRLP